MKKLGVLMLVLVLALSLVGCGKDTNKSGVGQIVVSEVKQHGKAYSQDIDHVDVVGDFNGWVPVAMQKTDGTWSLSFASMAEQPAVGASYGFSYYSSVTGSTPDKVGSNGWYPPNSGLLTVTDTQTEFVFDPKDAAAEDPFITKGTVTVGGKTGTIGTAISLMSGTYTVTVSAVIDDTRYTGTKSGVIVKKGATTAVKGIILSPEPPTTWRFTFDSAKYAPLMWVDPEDSAHQVELPVANIEHVYLAGEMNGWGANKEEFELVNNGVGTWGGTFDAYKSQLFNFLVVGSVESVTYEVWCPSGMGNNLIVDEATDGVEKVD